jgi:hypothetical protein
MSLRVSQLVHCNQHDIIIIPYPSTFESYHREDKIHHMVWRDHQTHSKLISSSMLCLHVFLPTQLDYLISQPVA